MGRALHAAPSRVKEEQKLLSAGGAQSAYALTPATGRAFLEWAPIREDGGLPFVPAKYAPDLDAIEYLLDM